MYCEPSTHTVTAGKSTELDMDDLSTYVQTGSKKNLHMLSMIFRFDGLLHGPGGLREVRNVLTINNMFCAYSLDLLWMKNLCFPLPITFLLIAITVTIYPRYNCHSFLQIIAKCKITIIYRMCILSILFITAFSSQSLKKWIRAWIDKVLRGTTGAQYMIERNYE